MENNSILPEVIQEYTLHLRREEKSAATVEKYLRYARAFARHLDGGKLTKEKVITYKELIAEQYTAAGANGVIAAVNSLLSFMRAPAFKVKPLKVQRRQFTPAERELSRAELNRLIETAQRTGKTRLCLMMQTMFSTGSRVSELRFITVQALEEGRAEIRLKGKTRTILLPTKLCRKLMRYARSHGIRSGPVFVTRGGNPPDRSNIWAEMKRLCDDAHVSACKVFPHNLRHLFARTYYGMTPNLAELADLMGHSNINTTRIYTATSGAECRKRLDQLRLII